MSTSADSVVDRPAPKRDRTHYLYIAVIVAMVLGIIVGFAFPEFGVKLKWLGTGFVNLIKMMITPIIFCTIVLGIGSVRKAAQVGKVGGLALGYFLTMSTFALAIGLLVGNIVKPGAGLHLTDELRQERPEAGRRGAPRPRPTSSSASSPTPSSRRSPSGSVLQALLVALLVGFALQKMGRAGEPILVGIKHFERLVFRLMAMIMYAAPIGAFGAMAAVVGATGVDALKSLAPGDGRVLHHLRAVRLRRPRHDPQAGHRGQRLRCCSSTSPASSCSSCRPRRRSRPCPRLIAKMEHAGVSRPVVGITVPTGYSFNLDGTAIYLTMASLFIADAMDKPFSLGQQISLLVFMIIASKGAAGVTGAGSGDPGRRPAVAPPRPGRRRRLHRRHRPDDERGPGADQLRRQLGRDGPHRALGGRARPATARRGARRRPAVRRGEHDRRRRQEPDLVGDPDSVTQGH